MPASKVKVQIKSLSVSILAVIASTYKRVEVGQGPNKRAKYRLHDTNTAAMGTIELKHPGPGGILSVQGINSSTKVKFSAIRRLKKK